MASFLVQSADLRHLVEQWKELVRQHQQPENGRFEYRAQVFDHLDEPEFRRIQWFYYNDNDNGVTIRLYDRAFLARCSGDFIDNDDCILRGYDLGGEQATVKVKMRAQFGKVTKQMLQGGDRRRETRSDFFEGPLYNNATQIPRKNNGGEEKKREDSVNLLDTVVGLLHQFRQAILYGPPGTGKTRLARLAALAVLNGTPITQKEEDVRVSLTGLKKEGRFELVVFHPAYEYEQFVGGIAPRLGEQGLQYGVKLGPFFNLCTWVRSNKKRAVLVIDEINRGNLPKLMGELVYALEYRDNEVSVPFEGHSLEVPQDLFIIGTMNSSDRSIGHIDAAIRRRFGLMLVGPEPAVVKKFWADAEAPECGMMLAALMEEVNRRLSGTEQGAEIGVGHSYFIGDPTRKEADGTIDLCKQVERKWMFQVEPLLREYQQLTDIQHDLESYRTALQNALDNGLPPRQEELEEPDLS